MLADPITIAANAPTPSLVFKVVKADGYGSERRDAAGVYSLIITHEDGKGKTANRHYVKISETKDAVNPYTGGTSKQTATVSLSVSRPAFGWTTANIVDLIEALIDTLNDAEFTPTNLVSFQS
ncbi:coat protein [ssRNA phage SRR5466727_9]|uniref:Coat protein n=1 Tax=ssRNA phage SRR5466727_9 TaxID=2786438 RepID=A0A8S5KYJ6_9VIRU|nr:coat protein [ssRNA phage SRR5466727_9]DAD50838.1 TPA_asm: coat protein [ssRNA phage SRR5466727_9]